MIPLSFGVCVSLLLASNWYVNLHVYIYICACMHIHLYIYTHTHFISKRAKYPPNYNKTPGSHGFEPHHAMPRPPRGSGPVAPGKASWKCGSQGGLWDHRQGLSLGIMFSSMYVCMYVLMYVCVNIEIYAYTIYVCFVLVYPFAKTGDSSLYAPVVLWSQRSPPVCLSEP